MLHFYYRTQEAWWLLQAQDKCKLEIVEQAVLPKVGYSRFFTFHIDITDLLFAFSEAAGGPFEISLSNRVHGRDERKFITPFSSLTFWQLVRAQRP